MKSHVWVEPDLPALDQPIRWCSECDRTEFEDGTVVPGWVTVAPCYGRNFMKAKIYRCRYCDDPYCDLWIYEVTGRSGKPTVAATTSQAQAMKEVEAIIRGRKRGWLKSEPVLTARKGW